MARDPEIPLRSLRDLKLLAGESLRMGMLSVASLFLGYLLTTVLTELSGLDPKAAYSIALVVCSVLNFFGCRHLVFRGIHAPLWQEAAKFFPSVLLFRAIEVMLFSALFSLTANYHIAYFATAAIAMAAKLLVSKFFIFRRQG